MTVEFTAHNIRLDDGTCTRPEAGHSMESYPWFVSARRVLETVFPGDKSQLRLADLGCLEGGYAVEFARLGFQVLGIEVRESNLAACRYVKSRTNLPNLEFVKDDAQNIAAHGSFDAVFCCGLLYHLETPGSFLKTLASATRKVAIIQTHFATDSLQARLPLPGVLRRTWLKISGGGARNYRLSRRTTNEGLAGQWYAEFADDRSFAGREGAKWSSWDNRRSFWIQREHLLQAMRDAGFDFVAEQFDGLGPKIAESMATGEYHEHQRGTFIGVKT